MRREWTPDQSSASFGSAPKENQWYFLLMRKTYFASGFTIIRGWSLKQIDNAAEGVFSD